MTLNTPKLVTAKSCNNKQKLEEAKKFVSGMTISSSTAHFC